MDDVDILLWLYQMINDPEYKDLGLALARYVDSTNPLFQLKPDDSWMLGTDGECHNTKELLNSLNIIDTSGRFYVSI